MNTLSRDTLIELYRTMLRIRLFEENSSRRRWWNSIQPRK
jgi:TPP-dependent pyruvate/acetoin dehydrogenase alpha subunit